MLINKIANNSIDRCVDRSVDKSSVHQSADRNINKIINDINKIFNKNNPQRLNTILTPIVLFLISFSLICIAPDTFASTYSASITTSGAKSINVAPSSSGTGTSISSDDITITTTCRSGYNLTLSTSVNDNNLYLGGDITNNASGTYFSPASGSTALSESPNTWGFALGAVAPTASSTFSAVPTPSSPTTIKTPLATPSDTDISDEFSVYYGVAVSSSMAPGTYKMIPDTNNSNNDGTIVYRLTMADACVAYTVNFNPTSTFEGNQLTGTGTVPAQTIYEGVATSLTSNTFTAPSGYYFAGWNTAPDGTGTAYSSGQSVTDIANVGETLTLYAMWTDCPASRICYNKNINAAVGTMGNQTANSNADVTLLASNFSSGDPTNTTSPGDYGFIGWSPVKLDPDDAEFRTKLATMITNKNIYGPNETINVGITSPGGKKLYAVWVPVAKDENDTELTLQTENLLTKTLADTTDGNTLNDKPNGYVTALRDARDHQVYAVAKLADGKYWMIENLRLESADTVGNNRFDPSITNQSLAQGYGTSATYGNFGGLADPESANFYDSTTANSLYYSGTQSGTASINIGTANSPGCRMPRYNNLNTSARGTNTTTSQNIYSYGNYYTWHAAIADLTYNGTNNQSTTGTSLCPTGWHLPKGGNKSNEANNEFWSLVTTGLNNGTKPANYDSKIQPYYSGIPESSDVSKLTRSFPNNFLYSGSINGSYIGSRGNGGHYWSSTVSTDHSSYGLNLDTIGSCVFPGTSLVDKVRGQSIRCVAGS